MGDIPIYNLTTLCLNGTLTCVDYMDVTMGDIPWDEGFSIKTLGGIFLSLL